MLMRRRHPAPSRGLLAAAALLPLALLTACESQPSVPANDSGGANVAHITQPAPSPVLPAPLRALDRAQLLEAVRLAADAAAAGSAPPERNRELPGRGFELRLPFGCPAGPEGAEHWANATLDIQRRTLRLSVRPPLSKADTWLAELVTDQVFDAAEGFWIERPWTGSEACPPPLPSAPQAPEEAARPTVAVTQFFAPDAPRTLQRGGRPYTITRKLNVGETTEGGFRVVLAGRIAAFADGNPVRCRVESNAFRPICVVAVEFTRVAVERTSDGFMLATWPR